MYGAVGWLRSSGRNANRSGPNYRLIKQTVCLGTGLESDAAKAQQRAGRCSPVEIRWDHVAIPRIEKVKRSSSWRRPTRSPSGMKASAQSEQAPPKSK